MNVTVVYGAMRKSTTYRIAQEVISHIEGAQVQEVWLPRDMPEFCTSCGTCFIKGHARCLHSAYTAPIREKLEWADLIILTSPVYALHLTAQLKALFDHLACMFVVHCPTESMFKKQGLAISTAAGPVYKKTLNEMKDNLVMWGVARTHKLGAAVYGLSWSDVKPEVRAKLSHKAERVAHKIVRNAGRGGIELRVRFWFYVSRFMQKKFGFTEVDVAHWQKHGWLDKARPWKNK